VAGCCWMKKAPLWGWSAGKENRNQGGRFVARWRPVLWSCFSVAVDSWPRECGRRCWVCGGFSPIGFPKATGGGS
jgi:hypothetical protein